MDIEQLHNIINELKRFINIKEMIGDDHFLIERIDTGYLVSFKDVEIVEITRQAAIEAQSCFYPEKDNFKYLSGVLELLYLIIEYHSWNLNREQMNYFINVGLGSDQKEMKSDLRKIISEETEEALSDIGYEIIKKVI